MLHTPSLFLSGRDCVTNTQTSVVHLSRLFHSLSAIPSSSICGFKPCVTLRRPPPHAGQTRKRKQTGISGGSYSPTCFRGTSLTVKLLFTWPLLHAQYLICVFHVRFKLMFPLYLTVILNCWRSYLK